MATETDLLVDAFGRIREVVHQVVEGLPPDRLGHRLESKANSIGWLIWHLTRIQDDHVAEVAGTEQVWTSRSWMDRFGLPLQAGDTGFGHSSAQVDTVRVKSGELLLGYHDETYEQTTRFLDGPGEQDFDRIVDTRWDPPVRLGVRLISVVSDNLQHAGQAAFVRGLLTPA